GLAATYSAVHYVQAQRFREIIVREWREQVFSQVDLLATATTMVPAPPIEAAGLDATFSLIRNTNPLNLLGVPAISIPCGFAQPSAPRPAHPEVSKNERSTDTPLPIGLQLAGRWWD